MQCCCSHSRFVLNSVVHAHDDSTHNFLPISAHYFQLWSIARIAFFHSFRMELKIKLLFYENRCFCCWWRSRSDVVSIFFGGQKHFCAILVYSTRTIGGGEKVLNHFPLACMHLCVTLIWSSIFPLTSSVCWLTLLPFEALRIYCGQSHPHRSCFIRWNKLAIMQFLRCPFVSCSKAVEFRFLSDVSRETFLWIFVFTVTVVTQRFVLV